MRTPEVIATLSKALLQAGYDQTEAESVARQYTAWLLKRPLRDLFLLGEAELSPAQWQGGLDRLIQGEPLQYVLGETEFMGLTLHCDSRALIPRGDSECLLEKAISLLEQHPKPQIADICTGSGAFALAMAHYLPKAQIDASDISPAALALANENCRLLDLVEQVTFYEGDMAEPLLKQGKIYDFVLCNPPYIASGELPDLPVQLSFEPKLALDGGEKGLFPYRVLAKQVDQLLAPGGFLLVEHGDEQQEAVARLLSTETLTVKETLRDWGNRPRGLLLQKGEK